MYKNRIDAFFHMASHGDKEAYKLLYKETYGKDPEKEIKTQDKYVFCCSILNSMLDNMVSAINECCIALRIPILNIKTLSKEVIK